MAYELRIERPKGEISMEEWLAVVDADPAMKLEGKAETTTDSGIDLGYDSPGLAVWNETFFDFRQGRIYVAGPSKADIAQMKKLAATLKAKVIGDEGEDY